MKKLLFIVSALSLMSVSCNDKFDYTHVQNTPIRSAVKTEFSLKLDPSSADLNVGYSIGTETAGIAPVEASESSITGLGNSIQVFQFNSQGLKLADCSVAISEDGSVLPELTTGLGQNIYLVANAGDFDFSSVTDMASFEGLMYPLGEIVSEDQVPLVGYARGVDIVEVSDGVGKVTGQDGDLVEFVMKKIVSKVSLSYVFDVEGYELTTVTLADAPAVVAFVEPSADGELSFFPEAIVESNFHDITNEIAPENKASGNITWFVSDNIRGSVLESTAQEQKHAGNAPAKATHIRFSATSLSENKILHYSVYLGEDNFGNYNIRRNNRYNVTVSISDDGTSVDERIDVEIPPIIVVDKWVTPANCYMLAPGEEVIIGPRKAVGNKDNTHLNDKVISSAGIVWQTRENGELALGSVQEDALTLWEENGVQLLTIKAKAEGNALVAVYDAEGNILWSWHIWVTAYDPETDNFSYNNTVFMNRSLGALNYTKGSERTEGWLYQWGRKDPFPPAVDENKTMIKLYDASGNDLPAVDTDANDFQIAKYHVGTAYSNLDYSIAHPSTFIYNDAGESSTATAPVHWITSDITSDAMTANLWSSVQKTIYDPCPAGWKVSTGNFWDDNLKHNSLTYTDGASTYYAEDHGAYINVLDKESVWVPFQGFRRGTSRGTPVVYGSVGCLWSTSSHADALRTWAVKIRAQDYRTMINYPRSEGFQVRCVKE